MRTRYVMADPGINPMDIPDDRKRKPINPLMLMIGSLIALSLICIFIVSVVLTKKNTSSAFAQSESTEAITNTPTMTITPSITATYNRVILTATKIPTQTPWIREITKEITKEITRIVEVNRPYYVDRPVYNTVVVPIVITVVHTVIVTPTDTPTPLPTDTPTPLPTDTPTPLPTDTPTPLPTDTSIP